MSVQNSAFNNDALQRELSQLNSEFEPDAASQADIQSWLYLIGDDLDAKICAQTIKGAEDKHLIVAKAQILSEATSDWPAALRLGFEKILGDTEIQTVRRFAEQQKVDCLFQTEQLASLKCEFACFDMDSTLIKAEVIDELAKHAGVGDRVAQITERAMQGELDFNQSFTQRMALLEGLSESVLENVATNLVMMDGAEVLLRNLRHQGVKTAIFSGGFNYFAKYLQGRFGFDQVFANHLDIEHGALTGRVKPPIINAQAKADLLDSVSTQYGVDLQNCLAVGDGANDLLMLAKAGRGVALRAKPIVQKQAKLALNHNGLAAILFLLGFTQEDLV